MALYCACDCGNISLQLSSAQPLPTERVFGLPHLSLGTVLGVRCLLPQLEKVVEGRSAANPATLWRLSRCLNCGLSVYAVKAGQSSGAGSVSESPTLGSLSPGAAASTLSPKPLGTPSSVVDPFQEVLVNSDLLREEKLSSPNVGKKKDVSGAFGIRIMRGQTSSTSVPSVPSELSPLYGAWAKLDAVVMQYKEKVEREAEERIQAFIKKVHAEAKEAKSTAELERRYLWQKICEEHADAGRRRRASSTNNSPHSNAAGLTDGAAGKPEANEASSTVAGEGTAAGGKDEALVEEKEEEEEQGSIWGAWRQASLAGDTAEDPMFASSGTQGIAIPASKKKKKKKKGKSEARMAYSVPLWAFEEDEDDDDVLSSSTDASSDSEDEEFVGFGSRALLPSSRRVLFGSSRDGGAAEAEEEEESEEAGNTQIAHSLPVAIPQRLQSWASLAPQKAEKNRRSRAIKGRSVAMALEEEEDNAEEGKSGGKAASFVRPDVLAINTWKEEVISNFRKTPMGGRPSELRQSDSEDDDLLAEMYDVPHPRHVGVAKSLL